MSNYDIFVMNDISSPRLIDSFDIIICDINGIAENVLSGVKGLFEQIKDLYPDKYIIAISFNNSYLFKVQDIVDDYLVKEDGGSFDESLQKTVNKAFGLLDNPVDYWEAVKGRHMKENNSNALLKKKKYELHLYDKSL